MADLSIIRSICKEKGMTLKSLSEKLNISEPGLQRILRTNSTKIETLEKISDILDTPLYEFFYGRHVEEEITFAANRFVISDFARIASDRYHKIPDKIKLNFDFYISEMINFIGHFDKVVYPVVLPNRPKYMFKTYTQIESTFIKIRNLYGIPFSQLPDEYKKVIYKNILLLEGFYFTIFGYNSLGFNDYLGGIMNDDNYNDELFRFWREWKRLTKNIYDPDFSPLMRSMGKFPDNSINYGIS